MKKIFYQLCFLTLFFIFFGCKNEPSVFQKSSVISYTSEEKENLLHILGSNTENSILTVKKDWENYHLEITTKIASGDVDFTQNSEISILNIELGVIKIIPEIYPNEIPLISTLESGELYLNRFIGNQNHDKVVVAKLNISESSDNELVFDPEEINITLLTNDMLNNFVFEFVHNDQLNSEEILVDYEVNLHFDYEISK